ncbi:MAG: hypothetical protein Q7S86_03420 [bacterium]|nr:hypothetical protein [bacterium]
MSKKSIVILGVSGILTFAAVTFADFKQSDWQFKKTIRIPAISVAQYVQVAVDKDVYAKSSSLADLRVIGSDGGETPYQLVVKNSSGNDQYYSSRLLDVSTSAGQTSFTLDLGSRGIIHDRITINTPSINFRRQVSVYASDTNSNWRLLTDKGYIYNFTDARANFSAGSGEVRFGQSTSRFVHVVIGSGEGNPVSVSGAQVYRYDVRQAQEEGLIAPLSVNQNTVEKSSELTADLGVPAPTHMIVLTSSDANFSRRVVIQASPDGSSWQLIGQGYIFKVSTSLFTGSELAIQYPETRARFIRAIVFNEDNRPLTFGKSATFRSIIRNIIWEADPNGSYSLYYGNSQASTPRYDLARIFQYIESENIPQASLMGEDSNSSYIAPAGPIVPFTEKYPYLLNTVLVILVIIIGVFVFFYIRKATSAGF